MTLADATKRRLNEGFTLVEAIMTIAILAITMATMATVLRYSDNSAMQARLDSRAMLEFAKQCNWLVNVPMSAFKESLTEYGGGSMPVSFTLDPDSSPGDSDGLLYEPPSDPDAPPRYYLMNVGTQGVFPYSVTLTVAIASGTTIEDATSFNVNVSMAYSPPTLLDQSPDVGIPTKTFNFGFQKW